MSALAALGNTYSDLILNALFRGVVGTPPTTVYFSLGAAGSVLTPVEITTTRTPVKVNRGWLSGMDNATYPYASSGAAFGNSNVMGHGFDIYCTGMGANTYTTVCLLVYDAASAGNLLAVFEPQWGYVVQLIDGDIVRVGRATYDSTSNGGYFPIYSLSLPASSSNYATLFSFNTTAATAMGAYAGAMVTDWLWRGFDSIDAIFPVATYPNVYLNWATNAGAVITDIPRLAIARSTGTWNAPVSVSAGVNLERKITNALDFTFNNTTVAGSYVNPFLQARMSNTPQAFNDILYSVQLGGYTLTYGLGDNIIFPAGNLDFILN